jgi:hypothetical protein
MVTNEGPETKRSKTRSPNYPAIDLEAALARAKEFYQAEGRNAAPVTVAVKHWKFKPKSSGGIVTVAALKGFGLLNDSGSGNERSVQLSELALRIILDTRIECTERDAAIKQAALMPKIHGALWKQWGTNLPSDETLRHKLIFDQKFNENTVGDFIKEYRATIKFANLTDSDTISGVEEDTGEGSEMPETQEIARRSSPTATLVKPSGDVGRPATTLAEISVPVGTNEEGKPIFAHVRFDAPLKKGMLASLKQLLDVLEKNVA